MKDLFLGFFIFLLAGLTYLFLPESCPEAARRCAAIFIFAAGFWAFDLLPVYVTSLIVVLLLCFSLAKPGGVLGMDKKGYTVFLAPFSSPVLMLFFGGFILAEGLQKNHCDQFLASKFLLKFTGSESKFFLGVMLTSALLSMWISNTASTVMMLGIIGPILKDSNLSEKFRKGILLSVPFSADIGGMATPIGSPPNALAMGFLSDYGIVINFLDWVMLCLPLMAMILATAWFLMTTIFVSKHDPEVKAIGEAFPITQQGVKTLLVAGVTIALWLTSPLHGIPEALIALLSAGALAALGLVDKNNLKNINWDVLILMWGGLALGIGIEKSQLGTWVVHSILPEWNDLFLSLVFGAIALVFSLFISNTASAALIIPIALEASPGHRPLFAITIALMCSIAMIFPVSTPPNAIAYGTGMIKNTEMIKTGSLICLTGFFLITIGSWWIIPWMIGGAG